MKLKYYLRGLGIGIIVTTIILVSCFSMQKPKMTDEQIIEKAAHLGMIMPEQDAVGELLDVTHLGDRNLAHDLREILVAVVLEMSVEIHVLQRSGDLLAHGIVQQVDAYLILVFRLCFGCALHNEKRFCSRKLQNPFHKRPAKRSPQAYFHSIEARTAAAAPSAEISNSAERPRNSHPTVSVCPKRHSFRK